MPLDPILDGPLGEQDAASITEFPALLANPQLLQLITQAEGTLGLAYQTVADKLAHGMSLANACSVDVYNAVAKALDGYTGVQEEAYNQIVQAIQQDVLNSCNTTISSVQNDLNYCDNDIYHALAGLTTGQILHITNPTLPPPDDSLWLTKWDQIMQHASKDVYIDVEGNIVSGVWIHPNYSLTWSNIRTTYDPASFPGNIFLSGFDFPQLFVPAPTENVVDYTCVVPKGTSTPVPAPLPPGGSANPPLIPPLGYTGQSPPIPSPVVPTPSPPVVFQPAPTPVANTEQNCCAPNITIQVNPTPVTVNVPPCPPPVVENAISVQPANVVASGSEGIVVDWEPDTRDIVEQFLDSLGFPKDFVLYYGKLTEDDEQIEPTGLGENMPFRFNED